MSAICTILHCSGVVHTLLGARDVPEKGKNATVGLIIGIGLAFSMSHVLQFLFYCLPNIFLEKTHQRSGRFGVCLVNFVSS